MIGGGTLVLLGIGLLMLTGKSAAEAMPLVHDHLARCDDCREVSQSWSC